MIAELIDGRIVCDVPHREKSLITTVPGAKWHNATLRWRLPLTWTSCIALRGVFGAGLEVGPELVTWAQGEVDSRITPAMSWREVATDPSEDAPGHHSLYPYQRSAVQFLRAAGSAVLADEMGVGKSPQIAVALSELEAWPALIVAPKSMMHTWAREITKWAGGEPTILVGSVPQRRKVLEEFAATTRVRPALITSYDLLKAHSRLAPYGSIALVRCKECGGTDPAISETRCQTHPGELNAISWGAVVADEAHRAKDPKSQQTRALWSVGAKARHRFALTGTPVANDLADFWSLLHFVAPHEWPSKSAFLDRYALTSNAYWGGTEVLGLRPDTEPEFRAVMEPRFLRRTKALILPHLPVKTYERRDVEMSAKQAKAYKELAKGMVAALDSGTLTVFSPLIQGTRLTQFASAMCEVEDTEELDEFGMPKQIVRMTEPSPKLDVLEEILEELGESPCAVFAASRQLLDLASDRLDKRGIPFSRVVGGMHPLERQDAIDSYNKGDVDRILISLGAGAEGLSLTRGSTEIFLDRSWSAVQNKQGEDRLHGTGRGDAGAEKLLVIDLIATGTIEEHRVEVLETKGETLENLVQDKAQLRQALQWGSK